MIANYYPGEDLFISFRKRTINNIYENLDLYADIFVYVSNGGNIVKFSKNAKEGYTLLTRISENQYAVFLTSAQSASLDIGFCSVSFDFVETSEASDLRLNHKSTGTVFRLNPNPITTEL